MAAYASRKRKRPRLFRLRYATRYDRPRHIQMSLKDAFESDDSPINYVATLTPCLGRLRPYKSELSPKKKSIGAARVQFLGHVISQDGVRPHDDKVAALPRMPTPADIKQLRSLRGGLSYRLEGTYGLITDDVHRARFLSGSLPSGITPLMVSGDLVKSRNHPTSSSATSYGCSTIQAPP